jgi:hypothetical protein
MRKLIMAQTVQTPKSRLPHVEYLDIHENGALREVAVVKKWEDGSISYIDIELLDRTDKGRLKAALMDVHADKDPLHVVLSRRTESNGMNSLDYFHPLVKLKRGKNAINTMQSGGLANVRPTSTKSIADGFTNPMDATL